MRTKKIFNEKMKILPVIILVWLKSIGCIFACVDRPLGMSNGEIKDWQISASSTNHYAWEQSCHEKHARIYGEQGKSWCPKHRSDAEWLQIDLGVASKITGVITQGRTGKREWVTSYMVSYSTDAFQWQYVTDRYGNQKIFQGNANDYALKHNYFDQSVTARFIKFHTIEWNRHPSLRVEIIGCQECNQILGLPPYGRIKASSCLGQKFKQVCQPNDGFLISSRGWSPIRRHGDNEWIELDIGHPTLINGLITKGRNDVKRNHWVTKYKISYSNDSVMWTYYKDANHLEPKVFGANADRQMERFHYLNKPFWARYVRFYPTEWNEQVGMRVGLIGCPFTGTCFPGFFRVNDNSNCVENLAYHKDIWLMSGNGKNHWRQNSSSASLRPFRSSHSPLFSSNEKRLLSGKDGHPFYAVDGNEDALLQKCAIINNYYTERPTLVVDLGRVANIAGIVLKTWQGRFRNDSAVDNSTFSYRDYMYGLDKFLVFVDKRPLYAAHSSDYKNISKRFFNEDNNNDNNDEETGNDTDNDETKSSVDSTIVVRNMAKIRGGSNGGAAIGFNSPTRPKFSEQTLCNFVTRNNYAIFSPSIHLQCSQPLTGRYVFIQALGRNNRWKRIFDAVICEIQVYEI